MGKISCSSPIAVACVLFCACGKTPDSVVVSYLNAKTWNERLPYVADHDAVRPLMEDWYSGAGMMVPTEVDVEPAAKGAQLPILVRAHFTAEREIFGRTQQQRVDMTFYVVSEDGVFKIDWPASVGLSDVKADRWPRKLPNTRFRARVKIEPEHEPRSSYRLTVRERSNTRMLFRLSPGEDGWRSRTASVAAGSTLSDQLSELCSHGAARVTLDLRVVGDSLVIERLVSTNWSIPTTSPPVDNEPAPLVSAAPLSDIDDWVLRRDADEMVRVDVVVLDLRNTVGKGRVLLQPCKLGSPFFASESPSSTARYALIAAADEALTQLHASNPSACFQVALALSAVHYLPPDEELVAQVEVAIREASLLPGSPTDRVAAAADSDVARARLLATAGLIDEAEAAISGRNDVEATSLREELTAHEKRLEENLAFMKTTRATLVADPARFRGKSTATSMCCWTVQLSDYGVSGPFAELNYRTGKKYNATCFTHWQLKKWWDADLTRDVGTESQVEVRMTSETAKAMAVEGATLKTDDTLCDHQVSGTFMFGGQISLGRPVFYLKTLHKPRPILPGPAPDWTATARTN